MKHLEEYRDPQMIKEYLQQIQKTVTQPWNIMEVCGGQTHGLVKSGLLDLLPDKINMVHGPGCPVCVTPIEFIDQAISLALEHKVTLCSFGDMLRVPGSEKSLLEAKALGADIRTVYSPLEAVTIAKENPEREVVFFAVGFETTAPANGLAVLQAHEQGLKNFSILASHVLVPPAIEAIMNDPECRIDAFLAAGHVCSVMGTDEYDPLCAKYQIPIVATGFEPVDLLQGILKVVEQLEAGQSKLENQYSRMVLSEGNNGAQNIIKQVFEITDRNWRGIGTIPLSGLQLREAFQGFDASKKFDIQHSESKYSASCIAGQILKGIKKPFDCPEFGSGCTPENPLGAPMVSSEGACAAYFYHHQNQVS